MLILMIATAWGTHCRQLQRERPEEFAPGLDPELQELADAFSNFKDTLTKIPAKNGQKKKTGRG